MKKLLILVAIVLLLGACSSMNKAIKVPPEKAKVNTDALCASLFNNTLPDNSVFDYYVGVYTGVFKDDWKNRLNVQQKMDVDEFIAFCKKKPEERSAREYGYWTGTKFRTLYELIPDEVLLAAGIIK